MKTCVSLPLIAVVPPSVKNSITTRATRDAIPTASGTENSKVSIAYAAKRCRKVANSQSAGPLKNPSSDSANTRRIGAFCNCTLRPALRRCPAVKALGQSNVRVLYDSNRHRGVCPAATNYVICDVAVQTGAPHHRLGSRQSHDVRSEPNTKGGGLKKRPQSTIYPEETGRSRVFTKLSGRPRCGGSPRVRPWAGGGRGRRPRLLSTYRCSPFLIGIP